MKKDKIRNAGEQGEGLEGVIKRDTDLLLGMWLHWGLCSWLGGGEGDLLRLWRGGLDCDGRGWGYEGVGGGGVGLRG